MKNILINETYINKTEGHMNGESGVYETRFTDVKELYKNLRKEFGRCTSKMYVDDKRGEPIQIGWVFEKKIKYDDCNEYFTQETWVSIHEAKPQTTVKHFYKNIGGAK